MRYPNIYGGGGGLFAFSAMDGWADWRNPVVASTTESGRGLLFHVTGNPILRFGIRSAERWVNGEDTAFESVEDVIVSGSLIQSRVHVGDDEFGITYVFLDNETVGLEVSLIGPSASAVVCAQCSVDGAQTNDCDSALVFSSSRTHCAQACNRSCDTIPADGILLAKLTRGAASVRFAWSCSIKNSSQALEAARRGAACDFQEAVRAQTAFFELIPKPSTDDSEVERAYYKAASVLKLNCWSAQGCIPFPWTTPDRWPHAHMWLWDSAFHAIGLRHISHEWAENAIRAMLSVQRHDGFIPHMAAPDPSFHSEIIQPPILAWASRKVYESTRGRDFLEYVYPRIGRFVQYVLGSHDSDHNGLAEWESGGASGMDNSPRFDQPLKDAIDLNCYLANDARHLAEIARELGRDSEAHKWDKLATDLSAGIESSLWDDETGFYYDNAPEGRLFRIKTVAGFTPLLAGVCSRERAESLVRHLTDPKEFWRAFPVPSVAADEPSFGDDMWRGPVWINCNYIIIEGLRNYGYHEVAAELAERTVSEVARWYASDGIIYEFYDSEAHTNPARLHRKKRGGPEARKGVEPLATSICDYNWTAALFIDLVRG